MPSPGAQVVHPTVRSPALSFDALAQSLGDPLLLIDEDGVIVHANPATGDVFGRDPASLIGLSPTVLLPPSLRERHRLRLLRHLRSPRETACRFEIAGLHADGRELDLQACLAAVRGTDGPLFSCLIRDVTEAKAIERRLRASEERLSLALRGARDAHWDWDLVTNRMHLSPRWRVMLGLGPAATCDDPEEWFRHVAPEDRDRLRDDLEAHLQGRSRHFRSEHRVIHSDGSTRWMLARGLAVTDLSGQPVRIAGSLSDITDRVRLQERLRREAQHDPLTELPNRAFFLRRLRQSMERARQNNGCPAVAYIDLDGFKQVNDGLGHHAGDELLVAFARRLRARLGDNDIAARLGGDEFVVLIESGLDEAIRIARELLADMREPFVVATGDTLQASASIGIAPLTAAHRRPEDVVRDADAALYAAKTEGKARHAVFDPQRHARRRPRGAHASSVHGPASTAATP